MPRNPHKTRYPRAPQRASQRAQSNALRCARSPTHSGAQVPCTMFVSHKKTQRENNYRDHPWVSSQARPRVTQQPPRDRKPVTCILHKLWYHGPREG
jgi:hypothetical protein